MSSERVLILGCQEKAHHRISQQQGGIHAAMRGCASVRQGCSRGRADRRQAEEFRVIREDMSANSL